MDEDIDLKAEIKRLIVERTCEWCDKTYDAPLRRVLACRKVQCVGYVLKHRRYWRLCELCVSCSKSGMSFEKWIFPMIHQIMPEHESLTAILDVQPMMEEIMSMNVFARALRPQLLSLDYVCGPTGRWERTVRHTTHPGVPLEGPVVLKAKDA